jgi:hypothetical protein
LLAHADQWRNRKQVKNDGHWMKKGWDWVVDDFLPMPGEVQKKTQGMR